MKRCLSFLALICAVTPSFAYEFTGLKWDVSATTPVHYYVSKVLSEDVDDESALKAVQASYYAWSNITCSYLNRLYQGRTDNTAWGVADNANVVSWRETQWDDSEVALGIASQIGAPNLTDSDIKFNGEHHKWAVFEESDPGSEFVDIASVGTHEAGHSSGLAHSSVSGATMWPSTGPGEIYGRTPSADDIAGLCELYPSGGPVPEPDQEPGPAIGTTEFGEDCSSVACIEGLFCVSDGQKRYCSKICSNSDECGDNFYCAEDSRGGGVCAFGQDPNDDLPGFGQSCGQGKKCALGLTCAVNDDETEDDAYCTGPCLNNGCPDGYNCLEYSGKTICQRESTGPQHRPGQGEACPNNLCQLGLVCVNDPANTDISGKTVPYCTLRCSSKTDECPDGFKCDRVEPTGYVCQKQPEVGDRKIGDPCFVNPLATYEQPKCPEGLVCVDYKIENQRVTEAGYCTQNCKVDQCCPDGWGCAALTPTIGQCRKGIEDSPSLACAANKPVVEPEEDAGTVPADAEPDAKEDSDDGCSQTHPHSSAWFLILGAVACLRRRK